MDSININAKQWEKEPKILGPSINSIKYQICAVLFICIFIGIVTPLIWHLAWRVDVDHCNIEADLR